MNHDLKLKDPGTCRIFFSSPFGGMEEEREELTKKYFPQIHHACDAKGIKFVPVDMRWGITKEAADNAQVMNICLREVERSDFFVGFFGQRYGWHSSHLSDSMLLQNFDNAVGSYPWVDKLKDRSMTEIEMRAGHLNTPGAMPACFCFRDKAYDDFMRDEGLKTQDSKQVMKYTVENEFAEDMLKGLVQEVVDTQDKTWGVHLNCKDPQEMAKCMFDTIWKFLTEVLLKEFDKEKIPYLIEQRIVQDQFVTSASRIYCGCESYKEQLMNRINGRPNKGTVVTGPAGSGKSALLANWMLSLRESNPHIALIYHFIGCAPGTERPRTILERILLELQDAFPNLCETSHVSDDDSTKVPEDDVNKTEKASNIDTDANIENNSTVLQDEAKDQLNGIKDIDNTQSEGEKDENSNKKIIDEDKSINIADLNEEKGIRNSNTEIVTTGSKDALKLDDCEYEKISTNLATFMPITAETKGEENLSSEGNKIIEKDGDPSSPTNKVAEEKKVPSDPSLSTNDKDEAVNDKQGEGKESKSGLGKMTLHQIQNDTMVLMTKISDQGHKVVIILDAINQQKSMDKTIKHLYWLPESFPDGVIFICSTLDSDSATHDLLITQREMDTLVISPFDSQLQQSICVETLKVAGKELSPHQLERVINSKETSNALFLNLVLYELSIYGVFSKLDEKIDSLIYVSGVKPLLQVILDRLELDYNSEDYKGNLVKDVLCCLIAARKGLSETELTGILEVPVHMWSPLFFALEHLLSQYTGLLGFAFSEMREAVSERYLSEPNHIITYKKKLIDYYSGIRKGMKPWNKNRKPEFNRVIEELPWLQRDIKDKQGLIDTLSDLSILNKIAGDNLNHLLLLWQETNLPWSAVSAIYMKAFDTCVSDLYHEQKNGAIDSTDSPGMKYMRSFFDTAYYSRGSEAAMEREIRILETCKSSLSAEKLAEYLRDARYYLAVAYSDQQNGKALPMYLAVHEECQRLLKEKENKEVKEMLAFTCNGIGLVYYHNKDYPKSKEYLERSKALHKEVNHKLHEASSTTNIGLNYLSEKKYEESLASFQEALKLYEDHYFGTISIEVGNLFTNIALAYRRMKHLTKADEYYHKSLEMKALNVGWNHPVIATAFMNLGTLETHRQRYQKAEEYTRKAIAIYEINECPVTERQHRMCRENLCVNMLKQGKKEQVLPLYIEITHILVDNGWMDEIIISLHRDMLGYMRELRMFKEVEKFTLAILASAKRRAKFAYILAEMDSKLQPEDRAVRPKDLTIESFVEEFKKDDELKILYVTDFLARSNKIEEIIEICHGLHDRQADLKESAYSFPAEALSGFKFYESALRVAEIGLEKYPENLELIKEAVTCFLKLEKREELLKCVPVLLAAPDWETISFKDVMQVAEALQKSHPFSSGQLYQKVANQNTVVRPKREAMEALKSLFPDGLPSSLDPTVAGSVGADTCTSTKVDENGSKIIIENNECETNEISKKAEDDEKMKTEIPANLSDLVGASATGKTSSADKEIVPSDNMNNSAIDNTNSMAGNSNVNNTAPLPDFLMFAHQGMSHTNTLPTLSDFENDDKK